ncbi:Fe-S cluster assembly protein SufD [uncultured Friedmanniella sp.]|uniref:Fe-S cluster assembly protein SufD n=1 Tax=uncultured Friedmanniella sp. TaxID=335381 RepID=UPI0035CC4C96
MTIVDQTAEEALSAVAAALETSDKVASHLHPQTSFPVEDHPQPTGREEIWRFTPLKRLRGVLEPLSVEDLADDAGAATVDVEAPAGVELGRLAPGQAPRGTALVPGDRAAAIASAGTAQGLHVRVPAELVLDEPVRVTVTGHGGRSHAHTVLEAAPFSSVTFVLEHRGSGVHAGNLEVVVGEGATVKVVSIQDWDDDAVHVGQHEARVGRDAHYQHTAVTFGGDVVRLNANARYAGPGGEAILLGLYFADAGQHLEHRLFVDHNQPRTISNVDYKGALQGQDAHTVWIGDVLIRKAGEGIETYESNRNLVLTDGCRAWSVPNLEIETGEIAGAGHASTTGRFDDEQLFYLRSRGIDENEARRLVVHGFFADIIRKIGIPSVEGRLLAAVEAELAVNVGIPLGTGSSELSS